MTNTDKLKKIIMHAEALHECSIGAKDEALREGLFELLGFIFGIAYTMEEPQRGYAFEPTVEDRSPAPIPLPKDP